MGSINGNFISLVKINIANISNYSSFQVYINSDSCEASVSKNCKALSFAQRLLLEDTDTVGDLDKAHLLICATQSQVNYDLTNFGQPFDTEEVNVMWKLNEDDSYSPGFIVKMSNEAESSGISIDIKDIDEEVTTVYNLNASFSQSTEVVRSVPVSKPLFKSTSKTKYIEVSSNATDDEYTNYSEICIDGSARHFGIKRKPFFYHSSASENYFDVRRPEKANIAGEIHLLTPSTEQKQIYSFKNGEQYLEIDKDALERPRLLPHYIYSYEYIIDGVIPNDDESPINLKLYGANGYESSASTSVDFSFDNIVSLYNDYELDSLKKAFSTYSFSASYLYVESSGYQLITKPKGLELISSVAYETTYVPIMSNEWSGYVANISVVDIFEQVETYVAIGNELSKSDIVETTENAIDDLGKYWIYDTITATYIPATSANLFGFDTLPEMHAKCIAYMKVSSDLLDPDDTNSSKKFIQCFKYEEMPPDYKNDVCHDDFLYIEKAGTTNPTIFMPTKTGITGDGSIDYYSLTYVSTNDLEETELNRLVAAQEAKDNDAGDGEDIIEETSAGDRIFIKQNYRQIGIEEFEDIDVSTLYTAKGNEPLYFEITKTTDYIFDLDITGATVYADVDRQAFSLRQLRDIYYNTGEDMDELRAWYTKNVDEENIKGRLQELSLAAFGIYYRINYAGKWGKIYISDPNGTYDRFLMDNPAGLFVKEQSFVEVNIKRCDFLSNYEFFVLKIGKTRIEDIDFKNPVYIDASKFNLVEDFTASSIDSESEIMEYEGRILARINQFGFITNDSVEYLKRVPVYTPTHDLYMFSDKDYYYEPKDITKSATTEVMPLSFLRVGENASNLVNEDRWRRLAPSLAKSLIKDGNYSYVFSYDYHNGSYSNISAADPMKYSYAEYFYKCSAFVDICEGYDYDINAYAYIDIVPYTNATILPKNIKYFSNSITHYILSDEISYGYIGYLRPYDKKFVQTKYFYPDLVVNNGLHYAKDGSYYTNVIIYDGTRGSISKSLILQPNVFNVTNYTYEYETYSMIDVFKDDVAGVNEHHYKDYYLSYADENGMFSLTPLSPESKSPTYWCTYIEYLNKLENVPTYTLKTKVVAKKTGVFNGKLTNSEDYDEVQYFDNDTYQPVIIRKNDLMFGITFHEKMSSGITELDDLDNRITWSSNRLMTSPVIEKGLHTSMKYAYEYDVVELKEVVYDDENIVSDAVDVYQTQSTELRDTVKQIPLTVSNEKLLEFTGTYTWNNPKHSYIFVAKEDGTYESVDIMVSNGFWDKDTVETTIPLKVSSYNFYVNKDEVSSTTATYMHIPMSYVVKAEIYHPSISYDYIVNEKIEVAKFTYIYDGKEYNYPSTNPIQENEDGTYTGKVIVKKRKTETGNMAPGTIEDTLVEQLVPLIKYIEIDDSSTVKSILHQPSYVSYEIFSYKESIALVNERVPVLYNTEFIPAGTHKVQFWNKDADTYTIKTVVDSYAHYVYNYKYETVPLVVSSYINAGDKFTVANIPVISYSVDTLSSALDASIGNVNGSITTVSATILSSSNAFMSSISNDISKVTTYIAASTKDLTETLIEAAYIVEQKPTIVYSYLEESAEYSYIISYAIDGITNSFDLEARYLRNTLSDKMSKINDSISYQSTDFHTYWMKVSYNSYGQVTNVQKRDRNLPKKSIVETIDDALNIHDVNVKTTYHYDGSWDKTLESEILPLAKVLKNLTVAQKAPTYKEFMVDFVPKLYMNCDFEREIVDTAHIDENGNVLSSGKHKPNPIDLAKKCIYRADILWNEMQKKGIVEK